MFHRLLLLGCIANSLAFGARAQSPTANTPIPSESTLDNWLRSGDPRLEAWGAHDVIITHDQNLVPDVLALAEKWQSLQRQDCTGLPAPCQELSAEQMDERDAMAAVLDALIQMDVPVPPDTLRVLAPDFSNDVALLLARLPAEESLAVALDLYHSPPNPDLGLQYISGALLALHPAKGFAAELLASIHAQATVFVLPPGLGLVGDGLGSACGAYLDFVRKGWPETGQYALSTQKQTGAWLVVGGADPVYASRTESTHYIADECPMLLHLRLDSGERARLVAEMSGVAPDSLGWSTSFRTDIVFNSLEQFDETIRALVQKQEQGYRATASALVQRGVLDTSEVESSLPQLELEIENYRGPGAAPIHAIPNLPANVTWSQ